MGRFDGAVALVTGASRGIGFSVAERLVSEGARVVITARGADSLRDAAERLGPPGTAFWVVGKVDDDEHRAAVYALIDREFGRIDHFVSNAGVNPSYGPMLDIEPAAMRKIIEINVISALTWSKDAVAAGLAKNGGSIVTIASIAGLTASPGIGFYGVGSIRPLT